MEQKQFEIWRRMSSLELFLRMAVITLGPHLARAAYPEIGTLQL